MKLTFKGIFREIIKQKREVTLVYGAILRMWAGTQIYQGIVNSCLLIATAYNTTLRDWLQIYASWLNFPLFFGILLSGNLIMMILHFKYIQPSLISFDATQGFKHKNPSVDMLKDMVKRLERIEEKLDDACDTTKRSYD